MRSREESAEQPGAIAFGQRRAARSSGGGQLEPLGEPVRGRPLQEGSDVDAVADAVLDGPSVDVGLGAFGERAAVDGEPAEQVGGRVNLFAGVAAPGRGDRPCLGRGPKPGQDVPGREPAQQLDVVRVVDVGDVLVQPALEQQDLLVDRR
ncbi:hypothetical protein [Plantactinospora alkalitolerans]|uniref:hypothetical protein n=1 Tax=Plantactinospora alkalitolerans TaxID=2789879 RepID=UPI001E3A4023|nr:hypothetical protein [Plantactinospora alkalitolerans]